MRARLRARPRQTGVCFCCTRTIFPDLKIVGPPPIAGNKWGCCHERGCFRNGKVLDWGNQTPDRFHGYLLGVRLAVPADVGTCVQQGNLRPMLSRATCRFSKDAVWCRHLFLRFDAETRQRGVPLLSCCKLRAWAPRSVLVLRKDQFRRHHDGPRLWRTLPRWSGKQRMFSLDFVAPFLPEYCPQFIFRK